MAVQFDRDTKGWPMSMIWVYARGRDSWHALPEGVAPGHLNLAGIGRCAVSDPITQIVIA